MYVLNVKSFFDKLKELLEKKFSFFLVYGYIGTHNKLPNPHWFFSIHNELNSKNPICLSCVCWESVLNRSTLLSQVSSLEEVRGKKVLIKGYISVFKKNAEPKVVVIDISLQKEESKANQIDELYKKLNTLGYFNQERKRLAPLLLQHVGIITSKDSDAETDIVTQITARFPTKIQAFYTNVQGEGAEKGIIEGIEYFNNLPIKPQVIIITRGGGSELDLQTFNQESLATAIYESKIMIVTAVGHTKNQSIADLTADLACATPTEVAYKLIPIDYYSWHNKINDFWQEIKHSTVILIHEKQNTLHNYTSNLHSPQQLIRLRQEDIKKLDRILNRLKYSIKDQLSDLKIILADLNHHWSRYYDLQVSKLSNLSALLESLSYHSTLKRGFAILKDPSSQKVIKSVTKIPQTFDVILQDGKTTIKR